MFQAGVQIRRKAMEQKSIFGWWMVMMVGLSCTLVTCMKLIDENRILRRPAQLTVSDPDRVVVDGRIPGVVSVTCDIMPCARFTLGTPKCEVVCTIKRQWDKR
jgi:hypothetical protein